MHIPENAQEAEIVQLAQPVLPANIVLGMGEVVEYVQQGEVY